MTATATPWPAPLVGTPTVAVIERALERRRLAHSLLLHGSNLGTLANLAHAIADRLLNDPRDGTQPFPPKQHPDFFALRPAGKSRQISAEATRDLVSRIQVSPQVAHRKAAVIYEADRMNTAAANIFLKTLEEPPGDTTIILITTRPYSLLPTIRSRCLHFRLTDAGSEALADVGGNLQQSWNSLVTDYAAWLEQLVAGVTEKKAVADQVMRVYGIITRFRSILDSAAKASWDEQKGRLPDTLDPEEEEAIEAGIANGIRLRLLADIEQATRDFAVPRLAAGGVGAEPFRRNLAAAIDQLEHDVALLRLNLNVATALEDFLLASLRIWSRK